MLARSLTLNLLGEAASLLLGFAASILLARLLGPSDRGLLAVELSIVGFTYAFTNLGLPISVEYHAGRRDRAGSLLGNTTAYAVVLALALVPAFWFLRGPIADAFARGQGGATWGLVGVLVPLTFVQWTSANQLSGSLRFGLFNILFAVSRATYLVVVVLLLTAAGLGVTAGLLGTAAAALVVIVGAYGSILRNDTLAFDARLMRRMAAYGARLQVGSLFEILNFRLDVIILQFFRPLAEVGYYIVAQVVAELVTRLASAFQSSVLPLVSSTDEDELRDRTTMTALRHQALLSAVLIALIAALGPVLLFFGFGPKFHASLVPMFILLPGIWFLNTGTVVSASLSGRGRPGLSSALSGLALVVTVALDLALIPPIGVAGAALASVAAYGAYGVGGLFLLGRMTRTPTWRLIVPTRADLRMYPTAAAVIARRLLRVGSSSD
jgi:O-antigen/teichoic acid export membrane protein